jgi:hypothetical protein
MSYATNGARWRAVGAAALLFLAGAGTGVLADRTLMRPSELEATLPDGARGHFREWIQEHHRALTGRMRDGPGHSMP